MDPEKTLITKMRRKLFSSLKSLSHEKLLEIQSALAIRFCRFLQQDHSRFFIYDNFLYFSVSMTKLYKFSFCTLRCDTESVLSKTLVIPGIRNKERITTPLNLLNLSHCKNVISFSSYFQYPSSLSPKTTYEIPLHN